MASNSGAPTAVLGLLIGAAVLGGGLLVKSSLDRQAEAIEGVGVAVGSLEKAVREGGGRLAAARPEPQRGPDPNERQTIAIEGAPVRGSEQAKVTIVEYLDFQCPFCGRVQPTLDQVEKTYGDQVRIAFKHLPLRIHPNAPGAAAAAEAAHRQGKFWEMHDKLFANMHDLSEENYSKWAREIGLDMDRFQKDVKSPEVKQRIDADTQEANRLGVSGTPAFFINGRFLSGAQPFENFKEMIDAELPKG